MCEPAFWLLLCAWTAPASGEVQSKVTCLALDPLLLIPSLAAASLKAGGRWVEVHQVWWSIAHLGSVLDRPHLILVAMRTRMELRIVPHQAQVQAKELSNGIQIGKYINHLFCMYVCKKKIQSWNFFIIFLFLFTGCPNKDGKFVRKISKPREIRILDFFVKKVVRLKRYLHCLARM